MKLTENQYRTIKHHLDQGLERREVARLCGVSKSTVGAIAVGTLPKYLQRMEETAKAIAGARFNLRKAPNGRVTGTVMEFPNTVPIVCDWDIPRRGFTRNEILREFNETVRAFGTARHQGRHVNALDATAARLLEAPAPATEEKMCSTCMCWLPAQNFHQRAPSRDGLQICKGCFGFSRATAPADPLPGQ